LLRSVLEDWQSRQRETRERKREDLDKLADLFRRQPMDPMLLRMAAASTADPDLVAHVGRLITADTPEKRSDAQGDVANQIGVLRSKL
jgi:hypothetical protein